MHPILRNLHNTRLLYLMYTKIKKQCIMCTSDKSFTLSKLILHKVDIKYVSNGLLILPTLGRLVLPYVDVAKWLVGLPIKRRVLSSNSYAIITKRLLHICRGNSTAVCAPGYITKRLFTFSRFPLEFSCLVFRLNSVRSSNKFREVSVP